MYFRYTAIALIFTFWKQIINFISNLRQWDTEFTTQIIYKRWSVLLFVIIFEIIIVRNVIGNFIFYLASAK